MKSTELGMTFQLLHLPVYVKKITLITFGFCFVSMQLCSVLCSLLLLVGRQTLVLCRSLISLSPIQQGCEKAFLDLGLLSLRSLTWINALQTAGKKCDKVEIKKVHCHISYNDKKTL